jgi:hypothetical protein
MSEEHCDSSRWVSLRRFAGWAFVVSSLSYSVASVVLVLTSMVWLIITRKRSQPRVEI